MKGDRTMMTLNEMIREYDNRAHTHDYIFGFKHKGNIYMKYVGAEMLKNLLMLDRTSSKRGRAQSLRFKPTTAQKFSLLESAVILCTIEDFENEVAESKYNRGEIFEKRITEFFGQTWTKDNTSFEKAGDIEVLGVAIQVKFEKATFMTARA